MYTKRRKTKRERAREERDGLLILQGGAPQMKPFGFYSTIDEECLPSTVLSLFLHMKIPRS